MSKSIWSLYRVNDNSLISPPATCQLGLFRNKVWHASLSISFSRICSNPAFSIPMAKPPAPANSSMLRYVLLGTTFISSSHLESSISLISGMTIKSSVLNIVSPVSLVLLLNVPFFTHVAATLRETPIMSAKLLTDML